jgi:hypothetical protein
MASEKSMPMWKPLEKTTPSQHQNKSISRRKMEDDFKALPPLGDYYVEDWFVHRRGEAAFSQVVNRTPEQAARARANPLPPNLETYAAALTRDDTRDESVVVEWSPFVVPDIERGDWITSMILDHRVAKHTANALMLYPSLEDH